MNFPIDIVTPEEAKAILGDLLKFQCIFLNGQKMHGNQEAFRLLYNYACHPDSAMWNDAETHVFRRFSGIRDFNNEDVYQYDIVKDVLTKAVYQVKYGFCKKLAFTGWYGETAEGSQVAINNDADEHCNSQIEKIGNMLQNPEMLNYNF